jgi:hypothetical protein
MSTEVMRGEDFAAPAVLSFDHDPYLDEVRLDPYPYFHAGLEKYSRIAIKTLPQMQAAVGMFEDALRVTCPGKAGCFSLASRAGLAAGATNVASIRSPRLPVSTRYHLVQGIDDPITLLRERLDKLSQLVLGDGEGLQRIQHHGNALDDECGVELGIVDLVEG